MNSPIYCCRYCRAIMPSMEQKMEHEAGCTLVKKQSDPLVRSVKKVRREWRKTPAGRLQTLLEDERKWKRRATIAANKLSEVRALINGFAADLVAPKDGEKL